MSTRLDDEKRALARVANAGAATFERKRFKGQPAGHRGGVQVPSGRGLTMVMARETIKLVAPAMCPECARTVVPEVLRSAAGFYVGTTCDCGPYSRESGYYASREAAQAALDRKEYGR